MPRNCKCPHLDNVLQLSLSELCKLKQGVPCTQCDVSGPNLWICLHKNCLHIGCSEHYNDHSTIHFKQNPSHCIHMNQSSQRIWCYICEMEVFILSNMSNKNRRSIDRETQNDVGRYVEKISAYDRGGGEHMAETFDSIADDDCDIEPTNYSNSGGLVGLQNIANTCYMNAALQALSNTPPLTGYFLECGEIIEANSELAAPNSSQRKTGLAKSYHRLVKDMWLKHKQTNGYVVPNGILYGIRNVHPMFRGFQQHDTQEFLRCFMDQLHEELKEITPPPPEVLLLNETYKLNSCNNLKNSNDQITYLTLNNHLQFESPVVSDDDRSACSTPSLSQSEAEYETCDSGVSEQSSLSDETFCSNRNVLKSINLPTIQFAQTQQTSTYSRSPSPTSSQRTNKSTQSAAAAATFKCNRSNSVSSINSLSNQIQSNQQPQTESTTTKLPHRSIISDVFDGKLLSSVQCLTCDRVSTREETFQDLSLPIPGKDHLNVLHQSQGILPPMPTGGMNGINCTDAVYQANQDGWFWWFWNWVRSFFWGPAVTLHDCMSAFFSADELKGDNMYSCEKCNKLRNGIKFSRVLALPEMLCVHLKRFRHDLSYSSKISSPVHFPLVGLDMRPYLHKECKSEVSTYDLTAVICHHGTVGGGHYTSFAKHELSGKWFEFDDQLVTEVSAEIVQNCEAYVLFYRKSNPQMSIIRSQAMQLEDIGAEHASDIRFFVSRQWLNKFKTFAEPGPIDNWALLCPHGGLSPRKASMASRLVVPLPQPLWDFLFKKFGGGPACNHLFECDICRQAADTLARRQNYELDAFSAYKDETTSTIYAISMAWFRQWQLFVGAVTDEEPGPINNKTIANQSDTPVSRGVKPGSDYAQINSTLWKFFYNIYGGGPEIILRGNPTEDFRTTNVTSVPSKERDERIVESTSDYVNKEIQPTQNIPIPNPNIDADKLAVSTTQAPIENGNSTAIVTHKKVIKNVSFEGDDKSVSDKEISSGPSSVTSSDLGVTNARRGKHHHSASHSIPNEIISKKDRRHRGSIKTNGLFGVEGKYSDYKNNIAEDKNKDQFSNYLPLKNGTTITNGTISMSEANTKLEEITPLLHQATISSTNELTTSEPIKNQSSITDFITNGNKQHEHISHKSSKSHHYSSTNGNSKVVYRKRFKTKSGRKISSYNVTETNLSDSDRN